MLSHNCLVFLYIWNVIHDSKLNCQQPLLRSLVPEEITYYDEIIIYIFL